VGRVITFLKKVSRRLSVVVVVRKARSSSLCDSEKVLSSLVSSRDVFSFPYFFLI